MVFGQKHMWQYVLGFYLLCACYGFVVSVFKIVVFYSENFIKSVFFCGKGCENPLFFGLKKVKVISEIGIFFI